MKPFDEPRTKQIVYLLTRHITSPEASKSAAKLIDILLEQAYEKGRKDENHSALIEFSKHK